METPRIEYRYLMSPKASAQLTFNGVVVGDFLFLVKHFLLKDFIVGRIKMGNFWKVLIIIIKFSSCEIGCWRGFWQEVLKFILLQ